MHIIQGDNGPKEVEKINHAFEAFHVCRMWRVGEDTWIWAEYPWEPESNQFRLNREQMLQLAEELKEIASRNAV